MTKRYDRLANIAPKARLKAPPCPMPLPLPQPHLQARQHAVPARQLLDSRCAYKDDRQVLGYKARLHVRYFETQRMLSDGSALRANHDVRQAHDPHVGSTCQIYSHRSSQAAFFDVSISSFCPLRQAKSMRPSQGGQVSEAKSVRASLIDHSEGAPMPKPAIANARGCEGYF